MCISNMRFNFEKTRDWTIRMTRPTVLTYANCKGRTRTYNQSINSALLCHWATLHFAHCHKPTWAVGCPNWTTTHYPAYNSLVTLVIHWRLQRSDSNRQPDAYETPALPLMLLCDLSGCLMSTLHDNLSTTNYIKPYVYGNRVWGIEPHSLTLGQVLRTLTR